MKPPISDPCGAPTKAREERSFRLDFCRSLVGYFCAFAVILTPILWLILAPVLIRPTSLNPLLVSLGAAVIATLLGATINMFYSVKVDRETVQGFNFWWTSKRTVRWGEITRVRFCWLGFPYAVVSTAKGHNFVWLPLLLSDRAGFERAVEEWAPAGNPLRLFLGETRIDSVDLR